MNDARLILQASDAYRRAEDRRVATQILVASVVDADRSINREAVSGVIPLQSERWWLPGAVSTGTNVSAEPRVPQAATALRIDASCKTPPSGVEFTAEVMANGVVIDNVSIGIGASTGISVMNYAIPSGARLTVNIIQTGSAANVTISISFKPNVS